MKKRPSELKRAVSHVPGMEAMYDRTTGHLFLVKAPTSEQADRALLPNVMRMAKAVYEEDEE